MEAANFIPHHNERAAAMMMSGNFDGACRLLRQTMRILRANEVQQDMEKLPPTPQSQRNPEPKEQAPSCSQEFRDGEGKRLLLMPLCIDTAQDRFSPNNAFRIHGSVFLLPPSGSRHSLSNHESAIVVLYNMGLALHCRGMLRAQHQSLESAQECYRLALSLLPPRSVQSTTTPTCGSCTATGKAGAWWNLLYMSAWANLGHIASHFSNQEEVQLCHAQFMELLVQDQGNLSMEDLAFFCQVAFQVEVSGVIPTLAAAA